MIYAATGHRPDKLGGHGSVTVLENLTGLAIRFMQSRSDIECAISGMAQGWDTAWAMAALALKIPLIAAIPFAGQDARWPEYARRRYRYILDGCVDQVLISPGRYKSHKYQRRNEWMVNRCGVLVALWDGSDGGTANCVRYAESKGLLIEIINLWDQWTELK